MKIFSTYTATLVLSAAAISASLTCAADAAPQLDTHHQLVQQQPTRALRGGNTGSMVEGAKVGFEIGKAIAPMLGGLFKKKKCHQLACWVAVPNEACGRTAADQVQQELTKGRDGYHVESVSEQGMWVRYWRTEFWPPDRSDIATGTCADGAQFVVTNCMGDHKVHC